MLNLKRCSELAKRRTITDEDRKGFYTVGFEPNELMQVKEMNEEQLKGLMVFCGIRVFNEVPLICLEPNEMRLAYVCWRLEKVKQKREEVATKLERRMKWYKYLHKAAELLTR